MLRFLLVVALCASLSLSASPSCTASFSIYSQPPNWPTGLTANLNVEVNNVNLNNGWAINFTAKGYGPNAPFHISQFWNTKAVTSRSNGDNTVTYTLTNQDYNKLSPNYIGFVAETTLPHPRNVICGVSINNIPCTTTVSPHVFPPTVPPTSILLHYTFHNYAASHLPLLVLVHGITEDRRTWDPLIPLFTPYYRVLAVDLRGHGKSQVTVGKEGYAPESLAADVYRTVVAVSGAHALPLMVGHSLGGTVVTVYAHSYPVRGVINIDQSMDLGSFQAGIVGIRDYLTADNATFQYTINLVLEGITGALNQSEIDRVKSIRAPKQSVVLGVWAVLLDLTPVALNQLVDNLLQTPGGIPELVLFGSQAAAAGYQPWLSARIPGAIVEFWNEYPSHYPHLIFPYRFAQRVRDFDALATQNLCK